MKKLFAEALNIYPIVPYEKLISLVKQRKIISNIQIVESIPGWVGSNIELITLVKDLRRLKEEIVRDLEFRLIEKSVEVFRNDEIEKSNFLKVLDDRIKNLYEESSLKMTINYRAGETRQFYDKEIDEELKLIRKLDIESFELEIKCHVRVQELKFSSRTLIEIAVSETSNYISITNTEDKKFLYANKLQSILRRNRPKFRIVRTTTFNLSALLVLSASSFKLIGYLEQSIPAGLSASLHLLYTPLSLIMGYILNVILVKCNPNVEVYPADYSSTSSKITRMIVSSLIFIIPLIVSVLLWLFPIPAR